MVSQFGSLGYTIMGKTADLTVVQKTIIDTLHKEGKPQTFIAKEAGCSQSAVSKHVNRKLSGRKKCGRKRCKTNRENHSLMRIVKQNRFKNLGELHKEWTEAGVKASRATTHRCVKDRGHGHKHHLPWPPELPAPPRPPELPAPPWPPELPAPPWPPELPAPPWPPLSVPLWRSPSCVPVRVCPEGPPERPPPLPGGIVTAWDTPSRRGELCQGSVVCHVFPPHVSIFSLFPVLV